MNWEALGARGELVGAIAVVMPLVFVGMEIRKNTRATYASTHYLDVQIANDFNKLITSPGMAENQKQVLRENYEKENIEIAFNPMTEKFEVADAAIKKDKSFIPNISIMWDKNTGIFNIVDNYITSISEARE